MSNKFGRQYDGRLLQKNFKNLRDTYVRKRREYEDVIRKKTGIESGLREKIASWPFFVQLRFIDPPDDDDGIRYCNVESEEIEVVEDLGDKEPKSECVVVPKARTAVAPSTKKFDRKNKGKDTLDKITSVLDCLDKPDRFEHTGVEERIPQFYAAYADCWSFRSTVVHRVRTRSPRSRCLIESYHFVRKAAMNRVVLQLIQIVLNMDITIEATAACANVVKRILKRRFCRLCRKRDCPHIMSLIAQLMSTAERKRKRATYMNRTHITQTHSRFSTFEGYLMEEDDSRFHEYTRCTRAEFKMLYDRLSGRLQHERSHRYPIHIRHRIAITLRYLGHGRSLHACAHEFKLGRSTVAAIVYEVCHAIVDEFVSEVLPTPTAETWARSAQGFQSIWGYPRGVAAIDSKHFRCTAPNNSGSSYFNYKGHFSIVLLIVADSNYKILLLDVGGKGRNSDSGLYRTSPIKPFLEKSKVLFPRPAPLEGAGVVEFHILADGGFPQATHMQRPYQQAEALRDAKKLHFNECFSRARRVVENVFGIITSRFRLFQGPLSGSVEHLKLLVYAACVLHNLLAGRISQEELLRRYPQMDTVGEENAASGTRLHITEDAHRQRDRMTEYFAQRDGYY